MVSDDIALALAHYRVMFPDLGSLGTGTPPATWKTEYDRVAAAFDRVLLTSGSFEGGQGTGERYFDQKALLRALHKRRTELDATYVALDDSRSMGQVVRVGW
jgi:hypothetical protein